MLKKAANTFVVKVLVSAINLIIVIMLSQWLGAQGKGEASLILTSLALLMLFCNTIGGASLIYLVPRHNIFQLMVISNLWSLIVCTASYFVLLWCNILPAQFIFHVCILTLINSFLATNTSVLLGKEQIRKYNLVTLLQAVVNLLTLWILLTNFSRNTERYITSLYIALLVCLFVSTILILPYLKKITFKDSSRFIRELTRLGLANQLGHMMAFLSIRLSYFLLNNFCTGADVGVYSNGVSLIESVLLVSNSIATVQYSTIANSQDKEASFELTVRMTRISIVICTAVMIPLLLLPSNFFVWLLGEEMHGVKQVTLLLAPGIFCYNIFLITGHYFSGIGKYMINAIGTFAGLVATIILSSIFISIYSIKVAALITDAAYIMTTITILYFFFKESKAKFTQLIPGTSDFKWAKETVVGWLKR